MDLSTLSGKLRRLSQFAYGLVEQQPLREAARERPFIPRFMTNTGHRFQVHHMEFARIEQVLQDVYRNFPVHGAIDSGHRNDQGESPVAMECRNVLDLSIPAKVLDFKRAR